MEKLSQHIAIEWLDDRRILFVQITNTTRADLDLYAEWIANLMSTWNSDTPFFICYDLALLTLTPYSRHMATRIGESMPSGLKGKTAIVLTQGFWGNIIIQFFNRYVPVTTQTMNRKFFTSVNEALTWMREGSQNDEPTS